MTDEIKLNLSQLTSSQLRQLCSIMQDVDAKSPTTNNELEEMINQMRRRKILAELLKTSQPKLGTDGRYFWRPIKGRHDIQVRASSLEKCYEKGVDRYLKLQDNYTLREVIDMYNDSRQDIAEATRIRNMQQMKSWFEPLLDKPLPDIKQEDLKKLYTAHIVAQTGTIKRKACRNIHSVLRQVFTYAKDTLKQDTLDIEKAIKSFKTVNPKLFASETQVLGVNPTNRLTKDELKQVIKACNEDKSVYSCAILLGIYSGARVSEVCGLLKSDIDFDNNVISISHALKKDGTISSPKEYKARVVPLPDKAVNALKRAIELSPEDSPYVFYHKAPRTNTEVLTRSQLHHYLTKHVELPLDIACKSMHDIRRTYASLLGESPIMPHALRELLIGHELTGLDRYYDVDATSIPEIVEKLNIIFANY